MGIGCGLLFGAAGWWGLLLSAQNLPWSPDALYLEAWVARKREVAAETEGRRIIFLGGSGVLYGISARKLTESLGKPVVNMGIHAALPLNFLLDEARKILSPGDTVVLMLEYEYFNQDRSKLNEVSIKYFIANEPEILGAMPIAEKLCFVLEVPGSVATASLWAGRKEIHAERTRIARETANLIDMFGDRSIEDRKDFSQAKDAVLGSLNAGSLANAADIYSPQISEIADFVEWADANNVEVLAGFPATIEFEEYRRPLAKERIRQIEVFFQQLGVPVVTLAEEGFLPVTEFHDTAYHLNGEGMTNRTRLVATKISESSLESN